MPPLLKQKDGGVTRILFIKAAYIVIIYQNKMIPVKAANLFLLLYIIQCGKRSGAEGSPAQTSKESVSRTQEEGEEIFFIYSYRLSDILLTQSIYLYMSKMSNGFLTMCQSVLSFKCSRFRDLRGCSVHQNPDLPNILS